MIGSPISTVANEVRFRGASVYAKGNRSSSFPLSLDESHEWTRLALPLTLGDKRIGIWLIGKRDPDDYFSSNEIAVLQVLANQVGAALANIEQTEQSK